MQMLTHKLDAILGRFLSKLEGVTANCFSQGTRRSCYSAWRAGGVFWQSQKAEAPGELV